MRAATSTYMFFLGQAPSGWATPRTEGSSLLATSSSSKAEQFMRCPRFLTGRWSFSRSTHRDATRKTSSSSTLKTAHRKLFYEKKSYEICRKQGSDPQLGGKTRGR